MTLAERVERLTGPCRETDGLIWAAIQGVELLIFENPPSSGEVLSYRGALKYPDMPGVARYTASLDAAMTLVPEGLPILVRDGYDDAPGDKRPYAHVMNEIGEGYAATKALAIVVAALRARAASESPHDQN